MRYNFTLMWHILFPLKFVEGVMIFYIFYEGVNDFFKSFDPALGLKFCFFYGIKILKHFFLIFRSFLLFCLCLILVCCNFRTF